MVFLALLDLRASDDTVLEPDLLVRTGDYDPDGWPTATPLLVVEVASPSTAMTERNLKRPVYEELGVPPCWLVDPATPSLTVLEVDGDRYREVATVRGDESFEAARPFPVSITPATLVR